MTATRGGTLRRDVLGARIEARRTKLATALAAGPGAYGSEMIWRRVCTGHELAIRRLEMQVAGLERGALE